MIRSRCIRPTSLVSVALLSGVLLDARTHARADIFRWDTGEIITGTEGITPAPGVDLSRWNTDDHNLRFAEFSSYDLHDASFLGSWLDAARFVESDLTGVEFGGKLGRFPAGATLNNADLSGAVVQGADFRHSRGFVAQQLYSTESYQARNLAGIGLAENNMAGWDFSGQSLTGADFRGSNVTDANMSHADLADADFSQGFCEGICFGIGANLTRADLVFADLTNANLRGAILTGADLSSAIIRGAKFWPNHAPWAGGAITASQFYSTASYQVQDLTGIDLSRSDLTGWDLAGQNLSSALFESATLTNANMQGTNLTGASFRQAAFYLPKSDLTRADLRGAQGASLFGAITTNTIHSDGSVHGLTLEERQVLNIRAGSQFPITIMEHMNVTDEGTLRLIIAPNDWDSLIQFEPSIPVSLGGLLALSFESDVDLSTQIGRTIRLFDWSGVSPAGEFSVASPGLAWDTSQLYTTGEVSFLAALPGNTNGDMQVDLADLNNVRNRFGGTGLGDTNGDGLVNIDDLNAVRNNFGAGVAAVPEPSSAILALLGALAITFNRRPYRIGG